MINNLFPTIGIEVHSALNTKSKMFSSSKSCHTDEPNTNINQIDLALPGALPSVNKEVVVKAIRLANALNMSINPLIRFDRKNYFYQDLPKGFQITQQFYPIGSNGYIELSNNRKVRVNRIHMEEDTAKEMTVNGHILLDYNRAGIPLIEIVSEPDMHSAEDAIEYLTKLKQILVFLNISDGKMENGSLRADVNLSVSFKGDKKYGTRFEIKNINSFNNIAKAIKYEIDRQSKCILTDTPLKQATLKWNDLEQKTEFMRSKEDAADYHYFHEPNIFQIQLSKEFVDNSIKTMNKLPKVIYQELKDLNVNEKIIDQLMDNFPLYQIFNSVYSTIKDINLSITWAIVELLNYLKNKNSSLETITNQQIQLIIKMLTLIQQEEINGKQAKVIYPILLDQNKDPLEIMKEKGLLQIKDEKLLSELLSKIVDANPDMLKQYADRGERVLKFYLGMLMKETHGQANPVIANKVLINIINNKLK